jgi:hypothetical protein
MTESEGSPFDDNLRELVRQLIAPYLREGEQPADIIAGMQYLAERRARIYKRATTTLDGLFVLLLFLICPWRPAYYPPEYVERMGRIRQYIFTGAAAGDFARLDAAVPSATLSPPTESLYFLHELADVEGLLRVPPGVEPGYELG